MKITPTDYSHCSTSSDLVCVYDEIDERPMVPLVDTVAIIQGALAVMQEEMEDKLLDGLAGKRLWGVDISKYQSNINWSLVVKRNKPDFVFVKATEGVTIVDKMYRSHKKNLEKNDILHGAYHFFSFSSSGHSQAMSFIRHARLEKGNMVPVLDVEYTTKRLPHRSKVIREIRSFCNTIEAHYGVKPIIYTHPHLYTKYLRGNFDSYPLWLCDYRNTPRYDWDIWQHTSRARLYGFPGRVDKNVMKSDKKTLRTLVML